MVTRTWSLIIILAVHGVARGIKHNVLAYINPGFPQKKIQPIWSNRLASYSEHINDRKALFYRFFKLQECTVPHNI